MKVLNANCTATFPSHDHTSSKQFVHVLPDKFITLKMIYGIVFVNLWQNQRLNECNVLALLLLLGWIGKIQAALLFVVCEGALHFQNDNF